MGPNTKGSENNTNWDIWFAGAFAAFTVDLLVYPLDTLKTRIQSPSYNTVFRDPVTNTARRGLYRGLYQGIGSVILATIPSSGAFFTTYEALKHVINKYNPPNSTLFVPQPAIHAIASSGAELVSCAILTPAEVLKQNAQIVIKDAESSSSSSRKRPSPTVEVFRQFRSHPTHLWRGYSALAARNLPFTGLQFPAFEYLKSYFPARRRNQKGDKPVDGILERAWITAISAGLAGSAAAWITTPIDVVKTRIMLSAGDTDHNGTKQPQQPRPSAFQIFNLVLKTEGLRGIFRGAILRCVWTSFGSGLYLGAYEGGRFYLEDRRLRNGDGDDLMGGRESMDENDGTGIKKVVRRDREERKVGVGLSRSQGEKIRKSGWQDD